MGDISSGAAMDIAQATRMARTMVLEWGMSQKLGFVRYTGEDSREMFLPEKDYSPETAHLIDEEVRRIVDEAFIDARRLLEQNWDKVVAVAEALLKHETLSGDDVERLMAGQELIKPTVGDLLRAEARRKARDEAQPEQRSEPDVPPGAMPSPA